MHSQLSAFHIDDERLQEISRASSTSAVVHCDIERTKPLVNICMSGVIATRNTFPGSLIKRIWVRREVPIRLRDGGTVMSRRWVTYADVRAESFRITGWIGVQKSGYSDGFREAIKKLNRQSRTMAIEDVFFKEMARSCGFEDFSCKCCPQCGFPMIQIKTACIQCGMIATYEGTNAKSLISVEALKRVEDDVMAATVGSAPRVRTATPAPPAPVEEAEEVEDERREQEAKEKITARLLEHGGKTQISSMLSSGPHIE